MTPATDPSHVSTHGTHGGYNGGCRCERCREAEVAYQRRRRGAPHRLPSIADAVDTIIEVIHGNSS
jgi:hypothetical protein